MKKIIFITLLASLFNDLSAQICPPATNITTHTSTNGCTSLLGFDFEKFGLKSQTDPHNFYNCMFYQDGDANKNPQNRYISPWETNNNWNVEEFYNKYHANQSILPDNLHTEGWELVKKWFGGQQADGTVKYIDAPYPYFLMYNKYTGNLRLFVLLPSELVTGNNKIPTGTQTFMIKLSYKDASGTNASISPQSALLSSLEPVMQGLESFTRGVTQVVVNKYEAGPNQYWLRADFPLYYDPCTCKNIKPLDLTFGISSLLTADVNTITTVYGSSTITGAAMNAFSATNFNLNVDFTPSFTLNNTINANGTININTSSQTDKNSGNNSTVSRW